MPKHNTYQLVNPVIEGTLQDIYDSHDPIDAAKSFWQNLSGHIESHVPNFMFSMRNISSGDLHHFSVSENPKEGKYVIKKLDLDIDNSHFNKFHKNVDSYNQKCYKTKKVGGDKEKDKPRRKRYDSSSSSSSSSSDIYPRIVRTSPVAMFHYNTRIYYVDTDESQKLPSTSNPQLVAVSVPVFAPVFRPALKTFISIWP